MISRPSSITKSSLTPRSCSSLAICRAPRSCRRPPRRRRRPGRSCAWLEAAGEQRLHRFQLRDQVGLVVPRAAAPDEAVLDRAGERLGLPVAFGAGRDRHHVLVRHQRDRLAASNRCPPRCRAGSDSPTTSRFSARMHLARNAAARCACKACELVGIELRHRSPTTPCCARIAAGQRLAGGLLVDRQRRDRRHLQLARALAQRVDGHGQQPAARPAATASFSRRLEHAAVSAAQVKRLAFGSEPGQQRRRLPERASSCGLAAKRFMPARR